MTATFVVEPLPKEHEDPVGACRFLVRPVVNVETALESVNAALEDPVFDVVADLLVQMVKEERGEQLRDVVEGAGS